MGSPFRQSIILKPLSIALIEAGNDWTSRDEKSWVLMTDGFGYDIGYLGSNNTISVPREFVTDLASIPGPFLPFVSPFGAHAGAAILHDYMYRAPEQRFRGRAKADKIFYEAMVTSGVPFWRAIIVYFAVRTGGFGAWRSSGRKPPSLTLTDLIESRKNADG
jgi:Protein of unknown function (DUF1353)